MLLCPFKFGNGNAYIPLIIITCTDIFSAIPHRTEFCSATQSLPCRVKLVSESCSSDAEIFKFLINSNSRANRLDKSLSTIPAIIDKSVV